MYKILSLENTSDIERLMSVEVALENTQAAYQKELQKIAGKVNVQGFRKGKTPVSVVKKMYGQEAEGRAVYDLVNETFQQIIQEKKLPVVEGVTLEETVFSEEAPLKYTLRFEVYPDIQLKDFAKLSVEKPLVSINDTVINKVIEDLLIESAPKEELVAEAALQPGDEAIISVECKDSEGKTVEDYQRSQSRIVVSGENAMDAFLEPMVRKMKVGEVSIESLEIKEKDAPHYGQTFSFIVTVLNATRRQKQVLDEKFVAYYGVSTVADFKALIKKQLGYYRSFGIESIVRDNALKALISANPFSIPSRVFDKAFLSAMTQRLQSFGFPKDQAENFAKNLMAKKEKDSIEDMLFGNLATEVRGHIEANWVSEALFKALKTELDKDEALVELEKMANIFKMPENLKADYQKDPKKFTGINQTFQLSQALDTVLESAQITEKPVDFDAFFALYQKARASGQSIAAEIIAYFSPEKLPDVNHAPEEEHSHADEHEHHHHHEHGEHCNHEH
jgi:trigger factor